MFTVVDSWARLVRSRDEIPETFQEKFDGIIKNTAMFPYTVFAPPDRWGRKRTNPKLLCLLDNQLVVFEKIKKEIKVTSYCFKNIYHLERGKCLLYSWLRINSANDPKTYGELVEYSTVVENLFTPIINRIREEISGCEYDVPVPADTETTKFDYLNSINYKFMNYGKQSILPGEKVNRIVYQPEIKERFLRRFWKYLSPSQITILTDKELIIIKEDDKNNHITYGGIWNYIPLSQIMKITLHENEMQPLKGATVHLANQEQIYIKYSPGQQNAWSTLQADLDC